MTDPSAFPYLIRVDSRHGPSGRWQRHVECPADPAIYGDGDSLVEAFDAMELRYSERAAGQDEGHVVAPRTASGSHIRGQGEA